MKALLLFVVAGFLCAQTSPQRPDRLSSLLQEIFRSQSEGRRTEAITLLAEATELLRAADPARPDFATAVQQIAGQHQARGFSSRAERVFHSALERAALLGQSHPVYLTILMHHAQFLSNEQQENKALAALERLISLAERSVEGEPFRGLACGPLARLYEATGRRSEAELLLVRQRYLPEHLRPDASNPFFGRLSGRAVIGSGHVIAAARIGPYPGTASEELVHFLIRQGRAAEAEKLLRDQIEATTTTTDAPLYGRMQPVLASASLLSGQQRWEEALALHRQIHDQYAQSSKPEEQRLAYHQLSTLAHISDQAGKPLEADRLYQQMIERALPPPSGQPHTEKMNALTNYGHWLLRHKRIDDAEKIVEQYSAMNGDQAGVQGDILRAAILNQRGDVQGAERIHEQVRVRQSQSDGQNTETTIGPLLQRALEAARTGRLEQALALGEQARRRAIMQWISGCSEYNFPRWPMSWSRKVRRRLRIDCISADTQCW